MADRAAILICLSRQEAEKIRERAATQRRSISGYVLNIVMLAVSIEERLFLRRKFVASLDLARRKRDPGSRTTMLLRCFKEEARRIRACAEKREMTISGYVLGALRRSWAVENAFPAPALPTPPAIEIPTPSQD